MVTVGRWIRFQRDWAARDRVWGFELVSSWMVVVVVVVVVLGEW